MKTRYVQRGPLWVPEHTTRPIRGLGDVVAWGLKKIGVEQKAGCGCPRRQAALNRWLPFGRDPVGARGPFVQRSPREPWPPISGGVAGEEARCTELDAIYGAGTCVCSEPLNTPSYSLVHSNYGWSADDSTRKCALEYNPGVVVIRSNPADFSGSNSATILNALPVGHSVSHVFKQVDDFGGQGMFVGGNFPVAAPTARRAVRGYVYFSDPFAFEECANSGKVLDFTLQGPTLSNNGSWNIYGWTPNWTPLSAEGCCSNGPGTIPDDEAQTALLKANVKGKWHRIEFVATNLAGTPVRLQVFWKNVTDNGPDYTLVDTSIPTAMGSGPQWTSTEATTLTNVGGRDEMFFNFFRWDGDTGPACFGYFAASHILYAAWSTDSGQRILGASEIEGGEAGAPSQFASYRRMIGVMS